MASPDSNILLLEKEMVMRSLANELFDSFSSIIPEGLENTQYNMLWNIYLQRNSHNVYNNNILPAIAAVDYLLGNKIYPCFPEEFELMMSFITDLQMKQKSKFVFPLAVIFLKDKYAQITPYGDTTYHEADREYFYRFMGAINNTKINHPTGKYHKFFGDVSFIITSDTHDKWDIDSRRYKPLFGLFTYTVSNADTDNILIRMFEYLADHAMSQNLQQEMQHERRSSQNEPIPTDIFSPLLFSRRYDADTEKDVQFSMKERSTKQSSTSGNFLQSLDAAEVVMMSGLYHGKADVINNFLQISIDYDYYPQLGLGIDFPHIDVVRAKKPYAHMYNKLKRQTVSERFGNLVSMMRDLPRSRRIHSVEWEEPGYERRFVGACRL